MFQPNLRYRAKFVASLLIAWACILVQGAGSLWSSSALDPQPTPASTQPGLPAGALRRIGEPTPPFQQGTSCAAFCPKTGFLALGENNGSVRLWDARNDRIVAMLPQGPMGAHTMNFSADGSRLAVAATNTFTVYSIPDRKVLRTVQLTVRTVGAYPFELSPDGKTVAMVLGGQVSIQPIDSTEQNRTIAVEKPPAQAVSFAPDGRSVIISSSSGELVRLQLGDDPIKPIPFIKSPAGAPTSIAHTPDGRELLAAHRGAGLIAYDARTGEKLREYNMASSVSRIGIGGTADEPVIGIRVSDGRTMLWRGKAVEPFKTLEAVMKHTIFGNQIAISPDGKLMAMPSPVGSFDLLDLTTMQRPASRTGHIGAVRSIAISDDARRIVSVGDDRQLRVVDVEKGLPVSTTRLDSMGGRFAIDIQGTFVRFGTSQNTESVIVTANIETGGIQKKPFSTICVTGLVPATTKSLLGTVRDNRLQLWDSSLENLPTTDFAKLEAQAQAIAFANKGRDFAVFEYTGVSLWDFESKTMRRRFPITPPHLQSVSGALADDASLAVMVNNDRSIRVMELITGGIEAVTAVNTVGSIPFSRFALFLPGSSRYLLSPADKGRLVVIDTTSAAIVHQFPDVNASTTAVTFARDGQSLVTGHDDGTLIVWPTPTFPANSTAAPTPDEFAKLWEDLGEADGMKGYRTARRLASGGSTTVNFIRSKLTPATDPGETIERLIKQLDDDLYRVREQATAELIQLGAVVRPRLLALKQENSANIETLERVDTVLAATTSTQFNTPDLRRIVRALAALDWINTRESNALIEQYAAGADGATLTREAKVILSRR